MNPNPGDPAGIIRFNFCTVERTSPIKSMTQEAKTTTSSRKKTPPPAAKPGSHSSTATGPVFTHYQAAVQLVQQGKYDRAIAAFEKVLPAAPPEIVERCKMYISTCRRQLDKKAWPFSRPENATTTPYRRSMPGISRRQPTSSRAFCPTIPVRTLPSMVWRCCIPSPARRRIAWRVSHRPSS